MRVFVIVFKCMQKVFKKFKYFLNEIKYLLYKYLVYYGNIKLTTPSEGTIGLVLRSLCCICTQYMAKSNIIRIVNVNNRLNRVHCIL